MSKSTLNTRHKFVNIYKNSVSITSSVIDMAKEEKQKGSSSVSQRRRRGQPHNGSSIKDEHLYDESEQDEQIQTLEKDIGGMATRSRRTVLAIGIPLTCIYLASAGIQIIRPWSLLHHRIFKESMDAMYGESSTKSIMSLVMGDIGSALTIAASTISVNQFIHPYESAFLPRLSWKNAVNLSMALMLLQLIYWSLATYALIQRPWVSVRDLWRVVWKPIIPLFWFITATYMIDSISKLQIDIATLKRLKYRYKKL